MKISLPHMACHVYTHCSVRWLADAVHVPSSRCGLCMCVCVCVTCAIVRAQIANAANNDEGTICVPERQARQLYIDVTQDDANISPAQFLETVQGVCKV